MYFTTRCITKFPCIATRLLLSLTWVVFVRILFEQLAHPWDLGLGLGDVLHLLAGLGVLRLRAGAGLPCNIDSIIITIID